MAETAFYNLLLLIFLISAAVTFPVLFFVDAPYGRYIGQRPQGPTIDNRLGWMVMEAPAAIVFALCFIIGPHHNTLTAWVFLGMWEAHYIHRAFIFPLGLRGQNKRIPFLTAALAFLFNLVNGYLNSR